MKFLIRLASVSLAVFSVSPLFGQFTNAQSIWNRPINSLQPANGQALCWDGTSTPPRWSPATCLNADPTGPAGTNGQGVPTGGTTSQMLVKTSNANFATAWVASPITQAAVSHQVLLSYTSTTGAFTIGQLAFGDISGLAPIAASGSASDLSTGTLPDARLSSNVVLKNQSNSYTAGFKQTLPPNGTTASFNLGTATADPSSLADGDLWWRNDLFTLNSFWTGVKGRMPWVRSSTTLTTGQCATWLGGYELGSIACGSGGSSFYQTVISDSSTMTQRAKLNLKAGTGITLTPVDNSGANSSEITITSTGGMLSGTLAAIPATCTVGASLYQATDQPITTQIYACTSTNTWTRAAYTQGTVASLPGTCTVGRIYFATDATAGANLYLCASTNTWAQVTGGAGTGIAPYISSLIAGPDTTKTITGATHGFTNVGLLVEVFDNSSPRNVITPSNVSVNSSTYDVIVTFGVAQSNYYVVINGGIGPAGAAGAAGANGAPGSGNNTYCLDSTGSSTTYTCPTPSPTVSTLTGLIISFRPQTTNTGTSTVNVAGLGAKTLKQSDGSTNISSGALVGGTTYSFSYDGTNFVQTGSSSTSSGTSAVLTSVSFSATPTFTAATSTIQVFNVAALTGNITSSTLNTTGATTGQTFQWVYVQDATGGRTVVHPTNLIGACAPTLTASKQTIITAVWNGTNALATGCAINESWVGFPEISTPSTPNGGNATCWADSTDHSGLECMANGSSNKFKLVLTGVDINPVTGQVNNGSHITNSSIPNSGLVNTTITVNGTSCTLGGSCTPSGGGNAAGTSTITFSATPIFDCGSATNKTVTTILLSTALTANITSSTLANCTPGQTINFLFTQDGTGGRTVAMPSGFSAAPISPTASTTTALAYFYDGTNGWLVNSSSDTASQLYLAERSASATPPASRAFCWPDSTAHSGLQCKANNSATVYGMVPTSSTQNFVFAYPTSGTGLGAPRLLVAGDMPAAQTTITTGTSASLSGTAGYWYNQHATAATGVTYTLPTAAAGVQYCVGNSFNGSAANTGVLTVATSASGQFIIFTDGTLSATGGNVTSGGAGGDFACFIGADSTHWYFRPGNGTWSKH